MIAESVSAEMETELVFIETEKLHDHPDNPTERFAPEAITELLASISRFGQTEAVRVRDLESLPVGHYQVISGHRRVAACRELGRAVKCEIVECDDRQALREVLLGNSNRQDFSPIERAELLDRMIKSGMDREEAGRVFGLESDSGIKNTLRLLKLPKKCRALLQSGDLPARVARYLVPWADAPSVLEKFADEFQRFEWVRGDFLASPQTFVLLGDTEWRPMDGVTTYNPGWEYKEATCGFEVTDAVKKKLDVVSLPLGDKGAKIEVTLDVKAFDKLNAPHVKRKTVGGYGREEKTKVEKSNLTPAQQAAEDRRKAKEADKRLQEKLIIWRRRYTRCALAVHTPVGSPLIATTLPIWIQLAGSEASAWIEQALASLGAMQDKKRPAHSRLSVLDLLTGAIAATEDRDSSKVSKGVVFLDRLWRILLWPEVLDWPIGEIDAKPLTMVAAEKPTKMAYAPDSWDADKSMDAMLNMMCKFGKLDVAKIWTEAPFYSEPIERLSLEYLELHNASQLERFVAKPLGIDVSGCKTRKAMVIAINTSDKDLPVPSVLLGETKKAAKVKS